jgi:hypothetical protein
MTDDRNRHSPGPTSIEPRDRRERKQQEKEDYASDPPREATHVETPGHVERKLPGDAGDEQGADRAWPNEGEGSKSADRAYRKGTEEFVKSGHVEEQARKAAEALDSKEGQELRKAENKGRRGKPRTKTR